MPERRRKIASLVAELKEELAASEVDAFHRSEIERTLAAIEESLAEEAPAAESPAAEAPAAESPAEPQSSPFRTPLEKAMAALERSNPALYKVALNLVNALSEIGI